MVKLIVYFTRILIIAITALLLVSCKYDIDLGDGIKGNGKVITENRNITESFNKINSNRGIEVIIEQGATTEVEVEADENLLKHIKTTIENNTLVITTDENIDYAEKKIVRVKTPTISELTASSGSSIHSQKKLSGVNLKVDSSSGSEIILETEYEKISCETSSGSEITISGKTLNLQTKASSGSNLDAENLYANNVYAESSSGSSINVHAIVNLEAHASSGSSIDYAGKPKKVTKNESSGASVTQIN
jgi:RNase P/RNase MRP subunit p29